MDNGEIIMRHTFLLITSCLIGLGFQASPAQAEWPKDICTAVCEQDICGTPRLVSLCAKNCEESSLGVCKKQENNEEGTKEESESSSDEASPEPSEAKDAEGNESEPAKDITNEGTEDSEKTKAPEEESSAPEGDSKASESETAQEEMPMKEGASEKKEKKDKKHKKDKKGKKKWKKNKDGQKHDHKHDHKGQHQHEHAHMGKHNLNHEHGHKGQHQHEHAHKGLYEVHHHHHDHSKSGGNKACAVAKKTIEQTNELVRQMAEKEGIAVSEPEMDHESMSGSEASEDLGEDGKKK